MMNKNIVIFIGEGNTEIAFFQEFIKRRYNISGENIKNGILYKVGNNFIVFAHPIIGSENHRGGDDTFKSAKTYIDINKKICDSCYAFGNISEYNFIYLFLTDKDKANSEKKIDGVEELIKKFCPKYNGKINIIYAIKEIETWFLAGLGTEFIENYNGVNLEELKKFSEKNIEKIDGTKEFLKDIILKNTDISSSQEYIGREFGKYIDVDKVKSNSASFKAFLDKLDSLFK